MVILEHNYINFKLIYLENIIKEVNLVLDLKELELKKFKIMQLKLLMKLLNFIIKMIINIYLSVVLVILNYKFLINYLIK